jgi:hypothetical protein
MATKADELAWEIELQIRVVGKALRRLYHAKEIRSLRQEIAMAISTVDRLRIAVKGIRRSHCQKADAA